MQVMAMIRAHDTANIGQVKQSAFLAILRRFEVFLTEQQLNSLLDDDPLLANPIKYDEFFSAFLGMPHGTGHANKSCHTKKDPQYQDKDPAPSLLSNSGDRANPSAPRLLNSGDVLQVQSGKSVRLDSLGAERRQRDQNTWSREAARGLAGPRNLPDAGGRDGQEVREGLTGLRFAGGSRNEAGAGGLKALLAKARR